MPPKLHAKPPKQQSGEFGGVNPDFTAKPESPIAAASERLSPEDMQVRLKGLDIMQKMGFAAEDAMAVVGCPMPGHENDKGTLADVFGGKIPKLGWLVTEITDKLKVAQESGVATPDKVIDRYIVKYGVEDDAGEVQRAEVPIIGPSLPEDLDAQKKSPQ